VALDKDGNVIASSGYLYRFNYQTGEFMNRYDYADDWWSLTDAAADDNGFVYIARVASGQPLHIINEDFEYYSNVADVVPTLQRSILVSGDGNNVYVGAIYSGVNGIRVYESVDGLGPDGEYALVDTIGTILNPDLTAKHNMWAQCLDWDHNGLMWVGTYWDVGPADFSAWYALDPTQSWGIVDTIGHNVGIGVTPVIGEIPVGSAYNSPRGVAFSPDGQTAYAADFDGGVIKKFTNASPKGPGSPIIGLEELVLVSLREDGKPVILVNFDLKQNYPNPFNPKTRIPFDISENVHVKLVVYDMNGRLVQTLVDQQLMPQRYEYEFDGSNLASGTYFYQLDVNGVLITKQMLLIK
jgi:DNA-binding beta-propeller fold protein YncE